MKKFSSDQLIKSLKKIKIKKNSILLVHSGINYLGAMRDVSNNKIPEEIFSILRKFLGRDGTLLFPAYFYDFARKKIPFNLETSEPCPTLGAISKYVFCNKKFYRSKNPLTSLMAIGKKAKYICEGSNSRSYGYNSAWDRLTKLGADILFIGVPFHKAMTYIHHIEFNIGVPHMYIKKFILPIISKNKILENSCLAYVRYLNLNIEVNQKKFEKDLFNNNLIRQASLGSSTILAVNTTKVFNFAIKKLNKNPYYFLNTPPKYDKKKYPLK